MKEIIKLALSTRFANEDVDAIYEVAKATGNLEVALSKLLGMYEEPYIAPYSACEKDSIKPCMFKSYDPFTNRVTYAYEKYRESYNPITKEHELTSEIIYRETDTNLSRWNERGYTEEDYKNELAVNAYEAEHC